MKHSLTALRRPILTAAIILTLQIAALAATTGHIFRGRLLDLQNGYAYFTTGDAVRIAPTTAVTDLQTHKPFHGDDITGYFARAVIDPNGQITALEVSKSPLPQDPPDAIAPFATSMSTPVPNPDLGNAQGFTGEPVLVSFTVAVPPTTALNATVYLSTSASQWDPMEIRMDRVDALHYRITRSLASGTIVTYRYTLGSWQASERGRDGLEGAPRTFVIRNLDVARRDDTVYHWSNENNGGAQSITPDSIPTPFNNSPFVKPPAGVPF